MSQLLEQFYGINVTPESDVTSTLPDIDKEELQQEYKKQYEKEANSWTNRFAIGIDNTQASLFKGLDLIADVTNSEGLKQYAQEGILKNQQEAAAKPQPTRTASLTEASKEIGEEIADDDFFGAAYRSLQLIKDMSAEALPSMLPTLGTVGATAIASPIVGAVPIVGGAAAIATRLVAPLVPGFLMGGGETYEEAKKLGAKDKDAQLFGVAGGVGIGLLEKIGAAHALKNLINTAGRDYTVKKLGEQVGKKTVKQAEDLMDEILKDESLFIKRSLALDAGKNAVKAGAVEGVTEGAQEALQLGAASLAADKGINAYDNAEAVNRIIDAAALGVVGGKVAGTGAGVVSNLQHKDVVNRAKDRLEKLNEIEELRKQEGNMSDEELLNTFDVRDETFKPSFIDNVFRQALTPLVPLGKKSRAGYEVVTALKNYNDNVSKDVGTYARTMDEALSKVRRSIKAPLIQGSVSSKKNRALFDVLMYGAESKDVNVREASEQIREQLLGKPLQPQIKLDKQSLFSSITKQKDSLDKLEKAKASGKLDIAQAQQIENTFNTLKNNHINTVNDNLKKGMSEEKATKEANQQLRQDKEFKNLQDKVLVDYEGTGLFGKLNESDIELEFRQNYFPRVYKIGLRDVVLGQFGMGKLKKARKILMEQEVTVQNPSNPKQSIKRKRTREEADEILDNIRANDGMYVPDTEITDLEANLDAPDNTKETKEITSNLEKQRVIDENTFKKLDQAGLVETDVKKVLDKYILQAVQRDNVRKIKKILDPNIKILREAKDIDKLELDRIKEIYQAIQNRFKPIQDERLRKASRFYLTYQYMLTLPLAALTALSEPIIVLTRVNPKHALPALGKATINTFRQAVRSILPKFKKSEQERAFMDILQGYDGTLAERLGDIAGIDVTRRVTDRFFKLTLLTQITQFSRDISFQAVEAQMKDDIKLLAKAKLLNKNDLKKLLKEEGKLFGPKITKAGLFEQLANAKKRLSELGLTEKNLNIDTGNLNDSEVLKWAEGNLEGIAPDIVRAALSKGVDDIIMAPNVVNRPLWMSNPHFALFAQLKGFMFAFGSKVGGRFYREVIQPLFKGRIPVEESIRYGVSVGLIVAASLAIKELKDEIRYGDEPSPFKDAEFGDKLVQALISTNIAGSGTMLYDAFNAQRYGLSPLESLLGPGPQHIARLVSAIGSASSGNPRPLSTHVARSIPFVAAVFPTKTSEISDSIEDFMLKYYS
tara:strand:+ start:3474 stop:7148 length:3675 start_codon:yes stop_codon:yes gene_type:complete